MDLKELSSNWKKLQATLKNEQPQAKKRKASDVLRSQRKGAKRTKTTPKPKVQNVQDKSMGVVASNLKPATSSASLAQWDIPAKAIAAAYGASSSSLSLPFKQEDRVNEGVAATADVGKYIAIDCEMVGVGPAPGNESALARVSIVNFHGHQIYDSFVQTKEPVTDYRTFVSGITPQLLQEARTFEAVQADVAGLLDGKILIGHAVRHDLDALLLGHPKRDIRDTSRHPAYRKISGGRTPGLKRLAKQLLGLDIQGGEHSSIEDARATMLLFRREKSSFEHEHQKRWGASNFKGASTGVQERRAKTKRRKKKKSK
ncbi:MAG: hypothetical protein Q9170_001235 [Blastenia crenularia]